METLSWDGGQGTVETQTVSLWQNIVFFFLISSVPYRFSVWLQNSHCWSSCLWRRWHRCCKPDCTPGPPTCRLSDWKSTASAGRPHRWLWPDRTGRLGLLASSLLQNFGCSFRLRPHEWARRALRESNSLEAANKYICCRNGPQCSLTLPSRQLCGLTDTCPVEGHNCQRVIHSTLQGTDPQRWFCGVVGYVTDAAWDYSHVAHCCSCCSWGVPAECQEVGLAVQVKIHVRPARNWYEREALRKSFLKVWRWDEQENPVLLPDSI